MKAGDVLSIDDYKGPQQVVVVGFHSGRNDMVIDDQTKDADAIRFCDPPSHR